MVDAILNFTWNWLLGVWLYWVPLSMCAVGYSSRTWSNYRRDIKRREETPAAYYPTDTVGKVLGRVLVTICPIANLWAATFDIAPTLFRRFFDVLERIFDQPLVPRRKS